MTPGKTTKLGRSAFLCILLTGAALPDFPVSAADGTRLEELRADIVYRCYNLMGEFGADGLDACVKAEQSAMQVLSEYPQQAGAIVQRCTRHVEINGWELARSCVDRDIAAENALAGYDAVHAAVLQECRSSFETRGAARVKACADERIAAARETKKD